jgi:hypothetical protein
MFHTHSLNIALGFLWQLRKISERFCHLELQCTSTARYPRYSAVGDVVFRYVLVLVSADGRSIVLKKAS